MIIIIISILYLGSMKRGPLLVFFVSAILYPRVIDGQCHLKENEYAKRCYIYCMFVGMGDRVNPAKDAARVAVQDYGTCVFNDTDSWDIKFNTCKFPNNTIHLNDFVSDEPGPSEKIRRIDFYYTDLEHITAGAFQQNPALANNLKQVTIYGSSSYKHITTDIFTGTNVTQYDYNWSNDIDTFDTHVFAGVASIIKDINFGFECGFTDANSVANMSGKCQPNTYPALESLTLYGAANSEGLKVLSQDMFTALQGSPKFKSLDLHESNIEYFEDNSVFDSLASLNSINLSGNLLKNLPEGALDHLLHINPGLQINLSGNPWHCDCHLKHLQDLLSKTPSASFTPFYCASPVSEAGKTIEDANMETECNPLPLVPPVYITCSN